ncbi:MAG: ABC transporter ATP-binding protein, partial [Endomicrobia bacterium]|nr:ABC transporter ATP-binding protein [Endomicrobiia bacterium]
RAALARALINDPKIIFADEPTGNLDRHTGLEIENLLLESSGERKATLILVTHNEELAAKADRQIRMRDGRII